MIEPLIDDLMSAGKAVELRVTGDSMHPAVRCGDLLIVDRVDPGLVRRGDVVLARLARGLTAHRVVRVTREGWFVTRGDNATADDEPFGPGALIGRARLPRRSPTWIALWRGARHLVAAWRRPRA